MARVGEINAERFAVAEVPRRLAGKRRVRREKSQQNERELPDGHTTGE